MCYLISIKFCTSHYSLLYSEMENTFRISIVPSALRALCVLRTNSDYFPHIESPVQSVCSIVTQLHTNVCVEMHLLHAPMYNTSVQIK